MELPPGPRAPAAWIVREAAALELRPVRPQRAKRRLLVVVPDRGGEVLVA